MPYDPGWPSYSSNWIAGSVYWPVNEASSTIWPLPQLKLNDLGTSRDLGIVCVHTRGELMAANVTRAVLPATAEEHEVVERMRRDGRRTAGRMGHMTRMRRTAMRITRCCTARAEAS